MGKFYTGKGDRGRSYIGKKSVSKTSFEVEALGQLDELNSMIGVLKSRRIPKKLKAILHDTQESLFIVQSHVANIMLGDTFSIPEFRSSRVKDVENLIDNIEKSLPPITKFIISGANPVSAWLDFMRAKSRNVERSVLRITNIEKLDPAVRAYLNRLSSLFFALARKEARDKKEKNPTYR